MNYLSIALICMLAGIVQGLSGFGAGIVMMLVLPSLFSLTKAAAICGAIGIFANIGLLVRYHKYCNFRLIIWPAIFYQIASAICIYYSTIVDQTLMKKFFGGFLILLSLYYLFLAKGETKKLSLPVSVAFWIFSGVCNGFFSIGGPLMVIYYLGQTDSKEEYFGTIQVMFMINSILATVIRCMNHILAPSDLPSIAIGIVCILAAGAVAVKLADRMNQTVFKKVVYAFIGISGILNLF